jgi:hypothetical protein
VIVYKVTFQDDAGSSGITQQFARSKEDAVAVHEQGADIPKDQDPYYEIVRVDIPTRKQELINFLNVWCSSI